jgi:hypothetical protein
MYGTPQFTKGVGTSEGWEGFEKVTTRGSIGCTVGTKG